MIDGSAARERGAGGWALFSRAAKFHAPRTPIPRFPHARFIEFHRGGLLERSQHRPMERPVKTGMRRQKLQGGAAPQAEQPLSPTRAFVVQFREEPVGTSQHFSGRVEHMISGDAVRFRSPEELLAFFARVLGAMQTNLSKER